MKKEYDFCLKDDKYCICENDSVIFSINKGNLEFDGNVFFEAIYKNIDNKEDNIEIILNNVLTENDKNNEKSANFTFETISDIIKKINEGLNTRNK